MAHSLWDLNLFRCLPTRLALWLPRQQASCLTESPLCVFAGRAATPLVMLRRTPRLSSSLWNSQCPIIRLVAAWECHEGEGEGAMMALHCQRV